MSRDEKNNEQNEESPIEFSLQLELMASFLGIIADALGVWAVLEAMEETKIAEEQELGDRNNQDDKFQKMQDQIDQLTAELAEIKRDK